MVLHEKYPQVTELTELVPLSFQILRYKMLDLHRKTLRRGNTIRNRLMTGRLQIRGDDPADASRAERAGGAIDRGASAIG